MMRLRRGKVGGDRRRAKGEFGNDGTAFGDRHGQFLVARRIDAVGAGADDGDGFAVGSQCAAMGGGVNAEGEAADDAETPRGQRLGERLGSLQSLRRGVAAADDGKPALLQQGGLPRT